MIYYLTNHLSFQGLIALKKKKRSKMDLAKETSFWRKISITGFIGVAELAKLVSDY